MILQRPGKSTRVSEIEHLFGTYFDGDVITKQVYYKDFKVLLVVLFFVDKFNYSYEDTADTNAGIVAKFSNSLVPHLFKALSTSDGNVVFSSFGLAANLIIAIEAADKSSASEIIELFKLGKNKMKLKRGFKALNEVFLYDSLKDDLAGVFSRVSVITSQPLTPAFEDTIRNYFQANITFASNDTSVQSGQEDFLSHGQGLQLESETGVVSHWQDYQKLAVYTYLSHRPSATFYTASNGTVHVPMIPQIGVFRGGYVAQIKSYIVELKLQTNCMRLVLMMPNVTSDSSEELQKLSFRSGLDELLNVIPPKEMEVLLPQLATITKDIDFVDFLRNFGVKSIFNNSTQDGGGGGSNKSNVFIESIKQNAYFSTSFTTVNSASAIESDLRSKTTSRTKREVKARLVFNKPFLFYLMHCKHGLILLAGKVLNPTQVPSR